MSFPSYNFGQRLEIRDPFIAENGSSQWSLQNNGGGSIPISNSDCCHLGIAQFKTGTTLSGNCALVKGFKSITFAQGDSYLMRVYGNILTQATVSVDYVFRFGFIDTQNLTPSFGAYWEYNRASNGNFWSTVTNNNGVTTTNVTSVAADSVFKTLDISVNGTGQVDFYSNHSIITSHTTNIPTTSIGVVLALIDTAGTTNVVTFQADDFVLKGYLNQNRL